MAEQLIDNDVAISLGSIDGEEGLKPRPGLININPPPQDGECMCCGRHFDELEPFGAAGDPLVGDFAGALLIKKFRTALPQSDAETERIYEQFIVARDPHSDYDKARESLIKECGERDAEIIMIRVEGGSQVGSSWECRDCIGLDMFEYFEKLGWDLDKYYAWEPRQKDEGTVTEIEECAE